MVVRESFQTQLDELRDMLVDLGRQAESALDDAIDSLKTQDVDKALRIIDNDFRINNLEEEINDKAILLIAKQAPVASDLRRIIVAIKISSDVERIADFAVNIAKSVIRIGKEPLIKELVDIPELAESAKTMLVEAIQAYNDEDIVLAKKMADRDDLVDEKYGQLIQELLGSMKDYPDSTNQIIQLSFICRYIERAADHATNIGENIVYLVKGKHYDLNE
ncbi:phosphate signaling complex protein PhoU [Pseudalkalibacillus berkeleyi]|uniref:Phosphate-specific transport system accessory protein PhoU n=1 Tax=Pseudalkalibacillus berkeleyi TaxID=1069813 RepID=A0ABS9H258_9BACL|nr:phosphate signaling complex protein PhoU [Pseudalkalibacillus berkeleyi]MCF6137917.1 phosphate signaling complex protein PhoU [Pseudalkalibacillus berkeleyi]